MSPDDTFYLIVGVAAVVLALIVPLDYALKRVFGIDMKVEFYAAHAQFVGAWYEREERREAAANRGLSSFRHASKRKN